MDRLVPTRRDQDCAVSVIAMLCHLRYEDVFVAAVRSAPNWKRDGGLNVTQMISTARRLGRNLKRVRWQRVSLDEHVGILGVNWNKPMQHGGVSYGHWVVLREGTIIDPVGPDVWDADEYMKANNGRIGTLLVER